MLNRCYKPNEYRYDRYGGRGISVCERWRTSFLNFLEDMGERPSGTTIDRIDNNGNYELNNCKWSTQEEQCSNTSSNVNISDGDITDNLSGWSRRTGKDRELFRGRKRAGWSDYDIINTKPRHSKSHPVKYELNGDNLSVLEWSKKTGIPKNVLYSRLKSGMTISESILTPYRITPRKLKLL